MTRYWTIALSVLIGSTINNSEVWAGGCAQQHPSSSQIEKPLTGDIKRGLDYLISQQKENGGWGQGEESANMGHSLDSLRYVPNVGDTCMAALALVRAGSYPNSGHYAKNTLNAVDFVCDSIDKSDKDSLRITDIQGTRIQMKLGPYVDTFLASLLLAETKGHMPNHASEQRLELALNKVIDKLERNQGADGKWANGGWAPVHAQAIATKALNRAKQVGMTVNAETLAKAEDYARQSFDAKTRSFNREGAAGVALYAAAAPLAGLQASINTNDQLSSGLKKIAESKTASREKRDAAKTQLEKFAQTNEAQHDAMSTVTAQLGDQRFIQGFGCNGGEEFLSYLDISETLKTNNDKSWPEWNGKITENIDRVQNNDGSWIGQHCITSRTFCTAAALLVLMVDRADNTVASKIKRAT